MTREEAMKVAREMRGWLRTDREREALETLIPELQEPEDERIRKGLLKIFKQSQNGYWAGMEIKDIVAYLEKQKEQKPVEIDEIIRKARSEGRQEVIDNPEYYQLQKPEEVQKPAEWSEEDEKMVYQVLCYLDPTITRAKREEIELWLKSLLERFNLQPKQERDEEDERVRKWLLEYFYLHRDDLRGASVTSMEILSFLDRHPGKGGACDVDEFSLTLRNCLSADSELTDEQADEFARAYGEDLYNVAIGEISTGLEKEDIEEYKYKRKQVEQWSNPSKCKHDLQDLTC